MSWAVLSVKGLFFHLCRCGMTNIDRTGVNMSSLQRAALAEEFGGRFRSASVHISYGFRCILRFPMDPVATKHSAA